MPFKTLASGLTIQIPTSGTKNWGANLEAVCWQKISEHDHTGSGKGKQLGAASLSNGAISAAKLASDAVTTVKIADGNVTLAKLANIATDRLLGRDTAGSGVPEEIPVGGGIEFSGAGSLRLSAGGVGTSNLADGAVTTIKLLDGNVTESKLSDDAATRSAYLLQTSVLVADATQAITLMAREAGETVGYGAKSIVMPKAGKVTHLSLALGAAITGGTLTITLYKNGVTTGKVVTITSGSTNYADIADETFAAGNTLGLAYTLASCTFSGGVAGLVADALGHFTE